MATVALTKDNFEHTLRGNDIVIVDFWAPWCGPCRGFAPVFEAASEKYETVTFGKVNTEDEPELAATFDIRSIPTLMVVRDQVIVFSQAGALAASALDQVMEKVLALDMQEVHRQLAARDTEAAPQK